ncbi:hypothetical protein KUTeg_013700 [Tegillarca granosa]|uniref:Uncharacterized protein n=1 Tax=Tegillarca granosa TaxID=220873 RepID=A0ABQ9EUF7_TEGGR|nr:hypothetical protein KUTeg_013700 [Tegillarca granosa]
MAVSRSGYIVWRLYKDTVYVGTRVTAKRPEGLKWEEAVREVQYITVDDSCAWYIKLNGDIMLQKGLSKDRPCFKAKKIPCSFNLKQIICQAGVVWGLTDNYNIVYRSGVTKSCVEGTDWTPVQT